MHESFLNRMMEAVSCAEELQECRVIRANEGQEIPYPIGRTIVCCSLDKADRMDYLLGYDECICEGEKLCVSVLAGAHFGGDLCEQTAQAVCRTILNADTEKEIVSVCVEKCMYDKINDAYKVIMRFSLREYLTDICEKDDLCEESCQ